jgi:hypothetical protein
MASTSPARIDDDLYASAKLAGAVQSRSASQQVVHWARIGREIETSASVSAREIGEVLAGARSYDSLDAKEQAVVRAAWAARLDDLRGGLDLAGSFREAGRTWVELDAAGNVVERGRRPRRARTPERAARSAKPKTAAAHSAKKQGAATRGAAVVKKAAAKQATPKRARAAG